MAECYTCHTALAGSWNLTTSPGCETSGRYLGITDGCALYSSGFNWVYMYCEKCWKKELLRVALSHGSQDIDSLQKQKTLLTTEITALQQQHTQLTSDTNALQQQKGKLTNETEALLQQKSLLTSEISDLQQQKEQSTTDIKSMKDQKAKLETSTTALQAHIETLKAMVAEIGGTSGVNDLQQIVGDLSQVEAQVLNDAGFDRTALTNSWKDQLQGTSETFVHATSTDLLKYPYGYYQFNSLL